MSTKKFLLKLSDALAHFFDNEQKLKEIWSNPNTRESLLNGLKKLSYGIDKLNQLQKLINTHNDRVKNTTKYLNKLDNSSQIFTQFILQQYAKKRVLKS